jgi:predicted Zn-ribbon and HTH transcriptional regulator
MKVIICDVVMTDREVELPNVCPKCNVSFHHEERPHLELASLETILSYATIGAERLESRGGYDDGEWLGTHRVRCTECGHVLAEGELSDRMVCPACHGQGFRETAEGEGYACRTCFGHKTVEKD